MYYLLDKTHYVRRYQRTEIKRKTKYSNKTQAHEYGAITRLKTDELKAVITFTSNYQFKKKKIKR